MMLLECKNFKAITSSAMIILAALSSNPFGVVVGEARGELFNGPADDSKGFGIELVRCKGDPKELAGCKGEDTPGWEIALLKGGVEGELVFGLMYCVKEPPGTYS